MEHIIGWTVIGIFVGATAQYLLQADRGGLLIAFAVLGAVVSGVTTMSFCEQGIQFANYAVLTICPSWLMAFLGSLVAVGMTYAATESWHEREPDVF